MPKQPDRAVTVTYEVTPDDVGYHIRVSNMRPGLIAERSLVISHTEAQTLIAQLQDRFDTVARLLPCRGAATTDGMTGEGDAHG